MIGHLRRNLGGPALPGCLHPRGGFAVPAGAADTAAPAVENAAGTGVPAAAAAPAPAPAPPAQSTPATRVAPRFGGPRHVHDAGACPFYGGMVRRKNVLGTVVQSFIVLGVISVEWVLVGTAWRSGPTWADSSGTSRGRALRRGACAVQGVRGHRPPPGVMIYQMMFAVITPALITGAFAERFKFSTYLVFTLLWPFSCTTPWPIGSGGSVVDPESWRPRLRWRHGRPHHLGVSAWRPLSSRKAKRIRDGQNFPHNLPLTVLGRPSSGSAGSASTQAAARSGRTVDLGLRATHIAAAAATLSWTSWSGSTAGSRRPRAASGCVAGLSASLPGRAS